MAKTPAAKKPAPTGPTLYALVIGCDLYLPNSTAEGSYPSLGGCVRDATRVEQFLRARAGLTDDHLIRLTSTVGTGTKPSEPKAEWPTYENIVNGFRDLTARATAGDHVYIHYSGHGGRCPTVAPKVKGAKAHDETLVPIDIGNPGARYVRDVEIAKLLKAMTDKKLIVTVVFDSCHSGGATRAVRRPGDPVGIRGVDFVDATKRPASAVLTKAEAAALPAAATRGLAPAGADATGCVVLAACRPFELAREFPFDGGPSQGALTYWLLKTAGDGAGGLTFRTVFDHVVKRIHDQFPAQTPMLFGDPDRAVLGGAVVAATPAVAVTAVVGKVVTLGAGQAALVQAGAEYAVYPAAAKDITNPAARSAVVRVTAVQPAAATAEVSETFAGRVVKIGDRAVPIGVPLKLVRKIGVVRRDGQPPTTAALKRVSAALAGQPWVEPAAGLPADFVVTTDKPGTTYQICDASDVPLAIRPELPTKDVTSAKKVVDRLGHLARFQAVQTLDNPDPASPLRGKVVVEFLKTPAGFQKGDPTAGLKPFPAGPVPRVKAGAWVVLSVTNRSAEAVNAVVLDLGSDWSVSVAHPDEEFFAIEANGEPLHLPLQAALPPGQTAGSDILKVITTVDPPPGFDVLTLPPLDQPIPPAGDRGPRKRSAGPLGALLAAAGADRPARALSTGGPPTRGWAVTHVKLEVE